MDNTSLLTATRYKLCPVDSIAVGHAQSFWAGGVQIAVFRQRDGALFATQALCPHSGGALADGLFAKGRVICPLHARKFDLNTGKCADTHGCLKTYPVYELDGAIIVQVEPEA